jgi:uncharacterized membrane protein YbhN (UPF0104 family)
MSKSARNALIAVLLLIVLAACAWFARGRVHFDWANLKLQMRAILWTRVAAGVGLIWLSIAVRAPRWRVLLGSASATGSAKLIGPQFVGFTVVALFGRAADLSRPYLTARRTTTPVATQLAVYFIERALDLAAAAILFAVTLAFAPQNMPHHEQFKKAGMGALALMAVLVVFLVAVRVAGKVIAGLARKSFGIISPAFGESSATKILEFREGLRTITSFQQFAAAFLLSLVVWAMIAGAYLETARAFADSPQLAHFSIPQTMLLLATSMGGSLLQLPVIGWFTQIGVLGVAFHAFFDVPVEVASAAGAITMLVTTLGVVPAGLIAAKIEGIGLRDAAHSGEALEAEAADTNS